MLATPPSTSEWPFISTGANTPGTAMLACRAGSRAPDFMLTSWPVNSSAVTTVSGISRWRKFFTGNTSPSQAMKSSLSNRPPLVSIGSMKSSQRSDFGSANSLRSASLWSTKNCSTWARISLPDRPEAYSAPTMAPILVPAITCGRMPSSSSVSSIRICARPLAPPPPSASPMRGSLDQPIQPLQATTAAATLTRKNSRRDRLRGNGLWISGMMKTV